MKKLFVPFCAIVVLFSIIGCAPSHLSSGERVSTVSKQAAIQQAAKRVALLSPMNASWSAKPIYK